MIRLAFGAMAMLIAASAQAQTPKPYHPPLTADGHPDFDGVWMNPPRGAQLEKAGLGEKLVVSNAEAKALAKALNIAVAARPQFLTQADLPEFEVAVVRGENRTRLLVEPADGMLPYTEAALKAVQAWMAAYNVSRVGLPVANPEDSDLSQRCITVEGQPPMRTAYEKSLRLIVQTPQVIGIYSEFVGEVRLVRMGGAHDPPALRSLWGDSVGHWEGEDLVVETRNFRLDNPFHVVIGERPVMVGADSVVIERFRRVSADELDYSFTVRDPNLYARPWLAEYAMTRTDEHPLEAACHEGNYAETNVLQGGRDEEAAQARRVAN
jgi:hypothetical protein